MDLKNTVNAALLLYQGFIKGKTNIEKIPFYPQKTEVPQPSDPLPLPRVSPERVGLSSDAVAKMLDEISDEREANVHSLLLLCDDKIIAEAKAPGYDTRTPHAAFSFSKSIIGMAVGLLIAEGKLSLNAPILSFFPHEKHLLTSKRMRMITVRHLLTMSSGVQFNEPGAVVAQNWVHAFLTSSVRFIPGTAFAYNSMNSYMLSAIICAVSGTSVTEYLRPRLFEPLGIRNVFWEKCPCGIEKGGWGLYLSTSDMTKFGLLLLHDGVWQGKRILPEKWVKCCTKKQINVPSTIASFHYGYHMWVHREQPAFLLNGMLGQNTLVYPEKKMLISITAGENAFFQDTPSLLIAAKHLERMEPGKPRRASFFARAKLRESCARFRAETAWLSPKPVLPFPIRTAQEAERELTAQNIFGAYDATPNSAGLLPFFVRLIQNNHTKGIRNILLSRNAEGDIYLTLDEGDARYTFHAGEYAARETILSVHGEKYMLRASYEWALDENREPILKIRVIFPELCSDRRIIIRKQAHAVFLSLSENPGFSFIEKLVESTQSSLSKNEVMDFVMDKIPIDQLMLRASAVFAPRIRLFPKKDQKLSGKLP